MTSDVRDVIIVHRRDQLRASKIMQDRAASNPKIRFAWNSEVGAVLGESKVSGLQLRDTHTGETTILDVTGVFVAIGHDPRIELVRDQVDLDAAGYITVQGRTTATSQPGVFACGDVVDHTYRQAITAAGTGCAAALDTERHLARLEDRATAALAQS
jgi:thioredoxin reductase (NADPH)